MIVAVNAIHARGGGALTYLRNILPVLGRMAGPLDAFRVFGRQEQERLVDGSPANVAFVPVRCPLSAPASLIWEQMRLPNLLAGVGADLLYCPHNYVPLAYRGPKVLFLRNSLAAAQQACGLYQRTYWWVYSSLTAASIRRAAAILSVSRNLAEEVRHLYRLDPALPITTVPHGVHPAFSADRAGPDPPASLRGRPYFLFVSSIYRHKNLHGLVAAFGEIARDLPDHRLAIVGQAVDRAYVSDVEAEARRSGIADRLVWGGSVGQDELPDWYRHSVALVFPSFAESFGNPPLEAMACGTPVLASRAGAVPEVCAEAAAYFDPAKPEEIAALMRRVALDRTFAAELSKRGAERARLFTWEKSASSLLAALRATLDRSGAARENRVAGA